MPPIVGVVRRYALDRIPTIEEIREIFDASDLRGKALTLVLLSSGIREGAIEMLRVGDYSMIKGDGQTKAGKLVYMQVKLLLHLKHAQF